MQPSETTTAPVIEKLTPVGYRVLVSIYKRPTTTASGLEMPETENGGMPVKGQIVTLGKKTVPQRLAVFFGFKPKYKLGQWVYFRKYSVDILQLSTPDGDITLYSLEEPEIILTVN
jgi:co-chaperonin GroES (HSP10)